MKLRIDIQIMRGIAVLVVVLFHLDFSGFANGFLGVDLFFVVSGFLMAVLYKQGKVKEFYLRRAARLLPAYGENCKIIHDDGQPYFFDRHHLTRTGARQLEPYFEQWLEQIKHER